MPGIEFLEGDIVEVSHVKQYNGEALYGGTSGGTSGAYTVTLTPAPLGTTDYPVGTQVNFKVHASNAASPTLNVNGRGARPLVYNGQALAASDLPVGSMVTVIYDGANWALPFKFGAVSGQLPTWTRPSDWLAMPTVSASEQKVVGLMAVYNHPSNYVALSASGAYTVDWGDGSPPQNVAAGVKAERNLAWADAPSTSLTSRGYRQMLITITPQSGQNLTAFSLQQRHSGLPAALVTTAWLDLVVSLPQMGVPTLGGGVTALALAERCRWISRSSVSSSLANLFNNFQSLQSVELPSSLSNVTSTAGMFSYCYRLVSAPLFNTAATTNFSTMFLACHSLEEVPLYNMAAATNLSSMFESCTSLEQVPNFATASVTSMLSMFGYCRKLKQLPSLNYGSVTQMSGFAIHCMDLESAPSLQLPLVVSAVQMFEGCGSLRSVGGLNLPLVTDLSFAFRNCGALRSVASLTTSTALTNVSYLFLGCSQLLEVPLFVTSNVTNAYAMLGDCFHLRQVPALNLASVTSSGYLIATARSLVKFLATGLTRSLDLTNSLLVRSELVSLFTNLGTASGSQNLIITGNPGVATLTPTDIAIATSKGWTVVA